MIYIREFEFYLSESGQIIAEPCDMEGGTFGSDLRDAVESASDWLYETVLDNLANHKVPEGGKLNHSPKHGGRIIAVSVKCDLSHADAVTAADAARMLKVSSARVAQMCLNGKLTSWKEGTRRMVLRSSIEARLEECPKAGRPRKPQRQSKKALEV